MVKSNFLTTGRLSVCCCAELQRRIQAMGMKCYRKILHISYKDHVTNEEVRAKIQQATGPHKDLLTIVKRRKLQWYCHVSRSSGLAETILQGTVKGGRRRGRQRKRWEDNIREWTGLEFAKCCVSVCVRERERENASCSHSTRHSTGINIYISPLLLFVRLELVIPFS